VKLFVVVIMLMGLAVGCSGNSNKAEATPAAISSAASSAAPARTPNAALGPKEIAFALALQGKRWKRTEFADEMDGHKSVSFSIYAIDYVASQPSEVPPRLSVTCRNSATHPYFEPGSLNDGSVRLRFDDGSVLKQNWHRSGDFWFPNSAESSAISKGLANANKAKLEYSPIGKATQVVTFNMADYRETVLTDPLCHK